MVEFNEDAPQPARREVGSATELQLPGGTEIAVSSFSFTEEANTSEVQFSDGFTQNIAVTGVTYSGSFEIPGNSESTVRDTAWDDGANTSEVTTLPKHIGTMTFVDSENNTYTFGTVLLNSRSKDVPADDRTTDSYDFMAETLVKD